MESPPPSSPPRALPTAVMVLLFHLVYLILPLSVVCFPVFLGLVCHRWTAAVTYVVAYLSWFALTHHSETDGHGRPWPEFENLWLFRRLLEWFPVRLVQPTVPLSPNRQYVFCIHPHGGLAFGRSMFGFGTRNLWEPAFPGINFRVLAATAALRVPVIREMWLWSYCVDARRRSAERVLRNGHYSLILYPGGVKEQILTKRGQHRVYLKSRKGFVKLALQHGCSLVPVYVFGETDLYDHWNVGLAARSWIADRFGAAVVFLSGSFGLLPYRVPLTGVSGPPVAAVVEGKRIENPTVEQIDELHAAYVSALQRLFDSEKEKYGYKDAILEIY